MITIIILANTSIVIATKASIKWFPWKHSISPLMLHLCKDIVFSYYNKNNKHSYVLQKVTTDINVNILLENSYYYKQLGTVTATKFLDAWKLASPIRIHEKT